MQRDHSAPRFHTCQVPRARTRTVTQMRCQHCDGHPSQSCANVGRPTLEGPVRTEGRASGRRNPPAEYPEVVWSSQIACTPLPRKRPPAAGAGGVNHRQPLPATLVRETAATAPSQLPYSYAAASFHGSRRRKGGALGTDPARDEVTAKSKPRYTGSGSTRYNGQDA